MASSRLMSGSWLPAGAILVISIVTLLAACDGAPFWKKPGAEGDVIHLDSGPVLKNDSGVYKGIPYAAAPTGSRRWRPPQPVAPWSEPRRFDEFGPICPQEGIEVGMDEDCLYLNVWTPPADAGDNLPVMAWIHGGAFLTGSGSDEIYDGEALSKHGVVVVTFNYRLGPLGFMAHPGLSAESERSVSGNYGLLDQVAALQWVQRNIAGFRGDPQKVTVFGESAGAASVSLLLVNPTARGLFRSAIAESPVAVGSLRPLRYTEFGVVPAESIGTRLATNLGIEDGNDALSTLRAAPWEKLDWAAAQLAGEAGVEIVGLVCTPTVDGYIVPDHPVRMFGEGKQHPVPLIAGTTANESTVFLPFLLSSIKTPEDYRKHVQARFSQDAQRVLQLAPVRNGGELWDGLDRLISARWFGAWADFMLESAVRNQSPAWSYRFTRKLPSWAAGLLAEDSNSSDVSAEKLGVPHGSELFYVFGFMETLLGFTDDDSAFSERMMTYWTNFAKTGNPNGEGQPHWPDFNPSAAREHLEFGTDVAPGPGTDAELFGLIRKSWLNSVY